MTYMGSNPGLFVGIEFLLHVSKNDKYIPN